MAEKNFEVILGGKVDEPRKSKEDLQDEIVNLVNRQDRLTTEEVGDLLDKMKKLDRRLLRESIARQSERIMTDEEISFIQNHLTGLVIGNENAKRELYDRFPDLIEYFEQMLSKLNLNQGE